MTTPIPLTSEQLRPGMIGRTPLGVTYTVDYRYTAQDGTPIFELHSVAPFGVKINEGTAHQMLVALTLLGAVITDPTFDTPQTFICANHDGVYLRGCSVVRAHSLREAYDLLDAALTKAGLKPWAHAPYQLTHLPDDFVGVHTLFNGDY